MFIMIRNLNLLKLIKYHIIIIKSDSYIIPNMKE